MNPDAVLLGGALWIEVMFLIMLLFINSQQRFGK